MVSMFLSRELIVANAMNLADIDSELVDAMKTLVVEYKLLTLSKKSISNNIKTILNSIQTIQQVIRDTKMFSFLYDTVGPELIKMQNKGQNILPFDELLLTVPDIQNELFKRLYAKHGKMVAYRPKDTKRHINSINKEFIKKLMSIFEQATGKKATASSESTRNRANMPLSMKLKEQSQESMRSQSPFEVFAHEIIQVINDSYDGLNRGYSLVINVNGIVKVLNRKKQ
ncbi:MAG: hypothetical protein IKS08_01855 [Alphaproteobacteria bacterium]|nr:hypothetical protein [Alphaproteobacteria bacterium]